LALKPVVLALDLNLQLLDLGLDLNLRLLEPDLYLLPLMGNPFMGMQDKRITLPDPYSLIGPAYALYATGSTLLRCKVNLVNKVNND